MAHEVAHITTDTYLRSPFMVRDRKIFLALMAVAFLFGLGLFLFSPVLMLVPMMILPAAPVLMGYSMRRYWPINASVKSGGMDVSIDPDGDGTPEPVTADEMKGPMYENDIVADSIAAKIISEPQALARAIEKMADLMDAAHVMPDQMITYNFLFIGPFKPWAEMPDAADAGQPRFSFSLGFVNFSPQNYELDAQNFRQMRTYVRTRRELISERLDNLEAIENGTWKEFEEVVGGKVRTAREGLESPEP